MKHGGFMARLWILPLLKVYRLVVSQFEWLECFIIRTTVLTAF